MLLIFTTAGSTKHRPKIYFKKSRKFLKAKLEFALHQELFIFFISEFTIYYLFQNLPCVYNYLHSIYIVLGIILISNLEVSLSIWEDMCRLYANTTWFCMMSLSICMGSWNESPRISRDNCILFSFLALHILLATSVFSMTLTTMSIWIFPNFIFPAWMTIVFSIVLDNQDADRRHLDISLNLPFVQAEFVSFLFVSFWLTVPLCT